MTIYQPIVNKLYAQGIPTDLCYRVIYGTAALVKMFGYGKVYSFILERMHLHEQKATELIKLYDFQSQEDLENRYFFSRYEIENQIHFIVEEIITPRITLKQIHDTFVVIHGDTIDNILLNMELEFQPGNQRTSELPLMKNISLNSLVMKILQQYKGRSLFGTDVADGEFLYECLREGICKSAFGYTTSEFSQKIAKLKAVLYGFDSVKVDYCKNHFKHSQDERYDLAYCICAPIKNYEKHDSESMSNRWNEFILADAKRKYSYNMLMLAETINLLNSQGVAIIWVPDGVLFNEWDKAGRRELINNKWLQTVIHLPTNILQYVTVPSSLLIVNKQHQKQSVRIIDASNIYTKQRKGVEFSADNIQTIIDLVLSDEDNELAINVPFSEIVEEDFHLRFDHYADSGYTLVNPCELGTLITETFRGYQISSDELDEIASSDKNSPYRMLNVSNISSDGLIDEYLQPIDVLDNEKKYLKYCIREGDLLMTLKSTTTKTAVYRGDRDYNIVLAGNVLCIRLDQTKIDPYYLKAYLDSKAGQIMLKNAQTGTTAITITSAKLNAIKVSVWDMETQKMISNLYKEKLDKLKALLDRMVETSVELENLFDDNLTVDIVSDLLDID